MLMEPWFADPIFSISKMRNQFEALWNWKEEKEKMELENEMKKKCHNHERLINWGWFLIGNIILFDKKLWFHTGTKRNTLLTLSENFIKTSNKVFKEYIYNFY